VDLIGEHHHTSEPAQQRAGHRAHGGEDVGRPVRAGHGRVAHGPGHRDRRVAVVEQVEQEGRFLDGVGALDDHGAGRTGRHPLADRPGELGDVADGQGRARHVAEIVHLDIGAGAGQAGHAGEQLLSGQGRDHAA